jgi:hypothetical protein
VSRAKCQVVGCRGEAQRRDLCWSHYEVMRQGKDPHAAGPKPRNFSALVDAAIALADAEPERIHEAEHNLARAAERYGLAAHRARWAARKEAAA